MIPIIHFNETELLPGATLSPLFLKSECGNPECGKLFTTGKMRCSRCNVTTYCNSTCQKAHWPTHKSTCKDEGYTIKAARAKDVQGAMAACMERWVSKLPLQQVPYVGGYWVLYLDQSRGPCYVPGNHPSSLDPLSMEAKRWVSEGEIVIMYIGKGTR